jgi:hypothetical protein
MARTKTQAKARPAVMIRYPAVTALATVMDAATPWHLDCNRSIQRSVTIGERNRHWYGAADFTEVRSRVETHGWPQQADKIERMATAIKPHLPRAIDIGRHRRRADQGDSLDIHAVYRGDLSRAWESVGRKFRAARSIVRVAVDVCGNYDMSGEQLAWRGVAALAFAKAIQGAGYSCEIVAGASVESVGRSVTITVPVKHRGEPVHLSRLAGIVCTSGFFRCYLLSALLRRNDTDGRATDTSIGCAQALADFLPADPRMAQFIVTPAVTNEQTALNWIKSTLALLQATNER